MYNVERLLLKALNDISDAVAYSAGFPEIQKILDTVNVEYLVAVKNRRDPIQWNNTEPPQNAREYKGHPAVRGTDYMEVHHLTGTTGCSPQEPYWTWPVLGVIESETGKQLVVPGDWIFEPVEGQYVVVSAKHYEAIFGERPARRLNTEELYNAGTQLFVNIGMDADTYLKKFDEGIGRLGLRGGDELTDKHVENILMTMFSVDRADLVTAADTRAKINIAQQMEIERHHRK